MQALGLLATAGVFARLLAEGPGTALGYVVLGLLLYTGAMPLALGGTAAAMRAAAGAIVSSMSRSAHAELMARHGTHHELFSLQARAYADVPSVPG